MMKAKRIQFARTGGTEVLDYVEVNVGSPDADEVLVRQHAIGLNFIDIYYRTGLYPAPSLPSGLGFEGVGVVEAVGAKVKHLKPGDRVAYAQGPLGAYSNLRSKSCSPVYQAGQDATDLDGVQKGRRRFRVWAPDGAVVGLRACIPSAQSHCRLGP